LTQANFGWYHHLGSLASLSRFTCGEAKEGSDSINHLLNGGKQFMSFYENQNSFNITDETIGGFDYRTGVETTYIYVTPSGTQFNLIGVLLGIGVIVALCFILWVALSRRVGGERPPIIIQITARRFFWEFRISGPNGFGSGPDVVIYSHGLGNNSGYVQIPFVVPYGRRLSITMSAEGVICRWRFRRPGRVNFNFIASPDRPDGGIITIPQGVYNGAPSSVAGYPHPNDRSIVMPFLLHAVSEPVFHHWYWSNVNVF
jgi:hypothetical protein